jgi:putative (di)nucleoside polyphosphate hydrolase
MAKPQHFRANVGIVVTNRRGEVLALERSDVRDAWQLPQGGLRQGEEPREAALRELREETGLREEDVEFVTEHPEWLAYELPERLRSAKTGRGQVQKWFVFRFRGSEKAIRLADTRSREFCASRWVRLERLASEVVAFRRGVYRRLALDLAEHLSP